MRFTLIVCLVFFLAACGSIADPRPTFAPTNTALPTPVVETDDEPEENEVAVEPTEEPTIEPTPEPTIEPTVEPTVEPTIEPTPEPAEDAVETGPNGIGTINSQGQLEVEVEGQLGNSFFGSLLFLNDADQGGAVVNYNNVEWQCKTCHNVEEPIPGSGPYLYGIANVAGERVEGEDAVTYLYNSIVNSNDHIAPPQLDPEGNEFAWEANVMPTNWTTTLDEIQIADLVAYLLTLDQPLDE